MADSSSAIPGLGGLIGSIIGQQQAAGDRGTSKDLLNQAIEAYQNVNAPTDLADRINYQQYQSAGQMSPAQEAAINAGPSQAAQVKANPALVQAQQQALNGLQQQATTGMTSADKSRLNSMQQQINTANQGQQQAVLQNFAQRGLGGSGNELLAKLSNSQNAANQANQSGLNIAGQAQQNALSALSNSGNLAGQMNSQQYGQQQQAAQAADELNRFNVGNQVNQQSRNVANQNSAQQYNLQNNQNLSNANTQQYNNSLNQQKTGEQQMYQDQLQKAQGLSGASFTGANAYNNIGNQTAQQYTNMGQGVGNILGGSGGFSGLASQVGGLFAEGGEVPQGILKQTLTQPSLTSGPAPQAPSAPKQDSSNDITSTLTKALPMIAMLAAQGGKVPGKPKHPGENNYDNDVQPAVLSPGEIVLPLTVTQSEDPGHNAKKFVQRILAEKKEKSGK